jgi:predicted RNase H-like HicB family nuclease
VDAGSPEDALEALREAAQAYVEVLIEDGRDIPADEVKSSVVEGPAVAVIA